MAVRDVARNDPVNFKRHDLGVFGLGAKGRDDRMQRAHPAQRIRLCGARAPAHGFGPGKSAHNLRQNVRQHVERGGARLLDDGDVELALALGVGLDFRLIERIETRSAQKSLHGGLWRADARAFLFLAHVRLTGGQACDVQSEPARRGEARSALINKPALHQRVRHQPLQVFGRLLLHAGGDFFAEQFQEQIGHDEANARLSRRFAFLLVATGPDVTSRGCFPLTVPFNVWSKKS